MNPTRAIALMALMLPAASIAQVSYSRATIEAPLLYVCNERQASLAERKAYLDMDKAQIDRENARIARDGARLAAELRSLDNRDTAAVAAYNARQEEHNRRVEIHNGYVAEMNRAASLLTGDGVDFMAYCGNLRFSRR
jgi:ribosome-binding ATPase YchF (GTP1/OBG family)